jgi:pyruvate dehydrogenase E2 component (dihydrolipoamide acetyltransferase)
MAHVLIMPRQGNTVESCIIVDWKVKEGATVAADTNICEVETDKATFEVPAGEAGVVLKILRPAGDDVPVLEPIAVIGVAGEDWAAAIGGASAAGAPSGGAAAAEPVNTDDLVNPASKVNGVYNINIAAAAEGAAASPRARNLAAKEAVDVAGLAGSGPGGRIIERDVQAALAGRPALTAAAKAALAAGSGVVPATGSGLGGRATAADLAAVPVATSPLAGAAQASAPASSPRAAFGAGAIIETPIKGVRKIIADRMRGSLETTAQLTFNGSANAQRLLALRSRFKASESAFGLSGVTIGDLVLYAVSRVLPLFPGANATLENGILKTYERVHLALAVDTPRGLMVPVIRNADLLSLRELSSESKRLAAACQAGNINPDDLSGGTFTVSNLGAFGIESFTPVLNAPQVAILGVDAIMPRAAAGPDGTLVLEQRLGLSLTVDHQIVDGAPAARLLKAFADAIADIDLLLAK